MKVNYNKPFYLIAEYWLGELQGFIKIGDDREEITKIFKDKYMREPGDFGVTEQSFELLEVSAKVILKGIVE